MHTAETREALIKQIVQYRLNNRYTPIHDLPAVLDNYLCNLPQNAGKCRSFEPLERGLFAYLKGGIALVKSLMYDTFVAQAEADRRSEICAGCKFNVFPDKTFFVEWSDKLAVASVGERKSKRHDELGTCEVCTCPLRCKVFHPGPFNDLTHEQVTKMKSVSCWQTGKL
jgi:hypothetical protein